MKIVSGDLIQLAVGGEFDVIIHGCNCQCTMGAGIAKAIKAEFPQAYQADLQTVKGDRQKLGTISQATVVRGARELVVVNGYTQFHWRGSGTKADYEAIRGVMIEVKKRFSGRRIAYPRIGAGLAGGDWGRIADIIKEALAGEDHSLVVLEGDQSRDSR